jgi:hypothetical protein
MFGFLVGDHNLFSTAARAAVVFPCSPAMVFGCSVVRLFGCSVFGCSLCGCSDVRYAVVRMFGCSLCGCSVVRLFGCGLFFHGLRLNGWLYVAGAVHMTSNMTANGLHDEALFGKVDLLLGPSLFQRLHPIFEKFELLKDCSKYSGK